MEAKDGLVLLEEQEELVEQMIQMLEEEEEVLLEKVLMFASPLREMALNDEVARVIEVVLG